MELTLSQAEVNVSGRKTSAADANGRVAKASSGFYVSVIRRKRTFVGLIAGCVEGEVKLQADEGGSQFAI